MKPKGLLALVTIFALSLVAQVGHAGSATPASPRAEATAQPTQLYIVSATHFEIAASAVREIGGEITHELHIIRSVGARLTPAQAEDLAKIAGIRQVMPDREVKTSSTCVASVEFKKVDGAEVVFKIWNLGSEKLTIDSISVAWPHENGALEEILLSGDTLYRANLTTSPALVTSGWKLSEKKRKVKSGGDKNLKLRFASTPAEVGYSLAVGFAQGCTAVLEPTAGSETEAPADAQTDPETEQAPEADCAISGEGWWKGSGVEL